MDYDMAPVGINLNDLDGDTDDEDLLDDMEDYMASTPKA
jgi:hypothetical protein